MITKMKKLVLLTTDNAADVDLDLTVLGELGVVHITPFQPAHDESIDRVHARIEQMEKAISILDNFEDKPDSGLSPVDEVDFSGNERGEIVLMEKVLETDFQRIQFEMQHSEQKLALDWYQHWGIVKAEDLEKLKKTGIYIRMYLLDKRELKAVSGREDIHLLGMTDEKNQVVLISEDENEALGFEEITLPQYPNEGLEATMNQTSDQISEIEMLLHSLQAQKSLLQDALDERIRRFDVRNIQFVGESIENKVRYWKGYIPENVVDTFLEVAKENSWGYLIEDPAQEDTDEVPTLIHSPRWVERIRPVMNFMGLVPGYKELDVSRIFMIFFTFFAGILIGDAGYGLVFLLLVLFAHSRQKFKKQIEFGLIYTLTISILFWGVLTGTYFGSESIADLPFLSILKVDKLASFGGDNILIQKVMFLIGAVHLSIGHLQLAWKYSNSVRALAQFGWVAIIWGLYLIVDQMVLGNPAPGITMWLFIGGAVLIALFSNPGKNFFRGMLASLANLPLSIISGFSDIISYIRLYAVGLSTVLMAASFNQMAIGDGLTTVASVIGAVIILLLGHGLNMILAIMSVIVHGVRLNMLEYSGHADVGFSGSEYNPFKLKNSKSNLKSNNN
jgi:V/A-type H+/Na+-transporting ATPase subunit I